MPSLVNRNGLFDYFCDFFLLSKADPLDSGFWTCQIDGVIEYCVDVLMAARCQQFSYSYFLQKLPMNSLVNWIYFVCNLLGMCSSLYMGLITLIFLIHFQEKM
jgi:hypothetical protein